MTSENHGTTSRLARTCARGLVLSLLACAGCRVGPDYRTPETVVPAHWSEPGPEAEPGRASADVTVLARWWEAFQDPRLSTLITRADAGNLDLAQATARLRAARAALTIAGARNRPSVDARASLARETTGNAPEDLALAGFDAVWELDFFGGVRRGVEAAGAELEAARFDREAVRVTLAAEVAADYLELRGAQRELEITRENLAAEQQTVVLTRQRFEAGLVGELDVQSAQAQVASTEAALPPLDASAHTAMHALGVLLGLEPEALLAELTPPGPIPSVLPSVPVELPAELLRRRPDIRAAEARLHAATARVGVATADLFPKITLSASAGIEGTRVSALHDRTSSLGASLLQPILAGGSLRAGVELQRAEEEEQLSAYHASVLAALQEVESALVAVAREQERRDALARSVQAQSRAVELATQLYGAGRTDYLSVLTAQRLRLEAEDALEQSHRQVGLDLIALFKGLGGGWEVSVSG